MYSKKKFLKAFEKHVKDSGKKFVKRSMVSELKAGRCPFSALACKDCIRGVNHGTLAFTFTSSFGHNVSLFGRYVRCDKRMLSRMIAVVKRVR